MSRGLKTDLLDILACPRCHGELAPRGELTYGLHRGLLCTACKEWYARAEYTYDFFPYWEFYGPRRGAWLAWRATQEEGAKTYQENPTNNLAAAGRQDCADFQTFCRQAGLPEDAAILDVGSGILSEVPSYMAEAGQLVGIEPLLGPRPARYTRLRGVAEALPFRAGTFDACYLGTSVDHFLYPGRSFAEIRRCLKPDGKVFTWVSCMATPVSLFLKFGWPPVWENEVDRNFHKAVWFLERSLKRGGLGRLAKRYLWEGFAYCPGDLLEAGFVANVDDPYHLGHYSHGLLHDLMAGAGFRCLRDQQYQYSAAYDVTEYFLEFALAG